MRTGTSRLLCAVIVALAAAPAAPRAAGLFDDPRFIFPSVDTARTVVSIHQAALEIDGGEASLAAVEARWSKGARVRIALGTQFPAVRSAGEINYGIGDMFVSAAVRLAGDTLEASGLYLAAACRAPSGSRALAPFSHASLDGSLGCEARGRLSPFIVRALARYTLAGERRTDEDYYHDNHATLAASFAVGLPRGASAAACAAWTGYAGGAARRMLCVSLSIDLSEAIAFAVSGAAESGNGGAAAFDRMAGISVSYRFPPRPAPSAPPAGEPHAP